MNIKHDILQPSGYDEGPVNSSSEVFADKKPIKTTGTTCDAFSARFENLHVFVKQLKPEFLSNSKFREAFRKEYEIGFSLYHSSLPRYIRFLNGDTIVIEFVDGRTLHDLIKADDPWLNQDSNIETLVGQLLSVMDYLHLKNIMHCDIKADNIMITNETRNLKLIDFDKAFSASHDLTPGTPLNYGTKEEHLTKRQMDIRGVGNVISKLSRFAHSKNLKLRLSRLTAATKDSDITMPDLVKIWDSSSEERVKLQKQNRKKVYLLASLNLLILIALLVVIWSKSDLEYSSSGREVLDGENEEQSLPKPQEPELLTELHSEINESSGLSELSKKEKNNDLISEIETETNSETPIQPIPEEARWELIVKEELKPLDSLVNQIEKDLEENKITHPRKIADLIIQINDETSDFNQRIMRNHTPFHKLYNGGQQETLDKAYKTRSMGEMSERINLLLPRMLEYQSSMNYQPVSSVEQLPDTLRVKFEKQVEKDLSEFVNYLKKTVNEINTTGHPIYGKDYVLVKIDMHRFSCDGAFNDYYLKFPEIQDADFEKLASTSKPYKDMVSLRDSVRDILSPPR